MANNWKREAAKGLGVALCLATLGRAADSRPPADTEIVAWVEKRVEERQPSAQDRRFDEIGWATDLSTAIRLGKEHHRPIFLFTMDGRINTGRC
jgi:hypothetical protein